jgi:hypothetical protein
MRSSGHFFVDVANWWEGRVANVLRAIPLKLISQNKIAACDALPLGPDRRIALPIRFGVKHRGQPSAFGSDSHAIPQPYACPAEQREAVTFSSRVIAPVVLERVRMEHDIGVITRLLVGCPLVA